MVPQLTRLKEKGADAIILVVNAPPGAQMMKSRERMGWNVPVVSHWGISGGRFPELAGPTAGDAHFVQTYSFFGKQSPVGERVLAALKTKYPAIKGPADIFAPVGTANAYDAMHLLALAIEQAGSTDGDAVRAALEDLKAPYQGLIKTYNKPFSAENHDALGPNDYIMVQLRGRQDRPGRRRGATVAAAAAARMSASHSRCMLVNAALITGLGLGSMYGLLALGFHVTYAVSNTVNFAQGSTMMLGAVLCFTFWVTLGWPLCACGRCSRCRLRRLGRARRARGGAAVRAARLQLLADGDGRARHRARERRAVHLRQGSARHAVRLPHDATR